MMATGCSFARAADNMPICPVHEQQLSIESEHGDLNPAGVSHLRGRCPISGQLVVEGENQPTQVYNPAA